MAKTDTKRFYRRVFTIMIPVLLQNGITNFVNMLDNLMVGRVGTAEMTGVSVSGQLIFVFALCIFGAVSGAGIFGAQFYGKGDEEGVRQTFRFKLLVTTVIAAGACVLFAFAGDPIADLFLRGEGDPSIAAASAEAAHDYLTIMLVSLLPFAWTQCWSSTLRETDRTVLPMVSGFVAMAVNLGLNYVLIFGHFGAPALGVKGAAIATVVSRFVELLVVAVYSRITADKSPFLRGVFRTFRIPGKLALSILARGFPLMLNETLWAAGLTTLNRYYSTRGLDVVAANNVNITFFNVFSVAFLSVGLSVGIILGQMLGAGEADEARAAARRLMKFGIAVSIVVGASYAAISGVVPHLYNTTDAVKATATGLMLICAASMPFESIANVEYFTLRSGGQALITFAFDSGFVWVFSVPTVILLATFTDVSVFTLYGAVQILNVLKCLVGYLFIRSGRWAKNIVNN
ncbi:MAG: MATE family efflux transporter [Clostridia bacterium]|nr:MATE family efflux transporter [Clostridia bacterium]